MKRRRFYPKATGTNKTHVSLGTGVPQQLAPDSGQHPPSKCIGSGETGAVRVSVKDSRLS